MVVNEFSEKIEILDNRLNENFEKLKEKAGKSEIGLLTSDKVTKDELPSYLPDMDLFEERLKNFILDQLSDL
jgi:hypothetical protein